MKFLFGLGALAGALALAVPASAELPALPSVAFEAAFSNPQEQVPTLRRRIAVGRFSNSTSYGRALLLPGEADPIATQAADMLTNALVGSEKFIVFERQDLDAITRERTISDIEGATLSGVDALVVGSVTQLGRRNEGQAGFLNSRRRQTVAATVEIRLVDIRSGHVFFTTSGTGEASTEVSEVAGFGSRAGYDSTLNDRAIAAAIADTMTNVIRRLEERAWFTDVLRVDGSRVFITGGVSQGIRPGTEFVVETAGDVVISGQTGLPITLPGAPVARIRVDSSFGDSAETEGSITSITSGSLEGQNLQRLRVMEIR
ncbi:MAG: CsgG/HfaB family protein [Brevundimonas sp.]|uniref:CsgG/HfaB family protein n=1 Tax=Brevundimonas sp. TaxID=1871086 RepID=UPI00272572B5|nr:CsgG/HfaB family protein [Brevundimonas sp.]MDO9076125.1 CsgG/HfaB family protein [Brevundimonas sp.]MDP3080074.1 CsgG/HfaB family protein [Brevundimonas sp.]MDZ4060215.1 CsgG/HfaB family protein [Brevundimonas sp.]